MGNKHCFVDPSSNSSPSSPTPTSSSTHPKLHPMISSSLAAPANHSPSLVPVLTPNISNSKSKSKSVKLFKLLPKIKQIKYGATHSPITTKLMRLSNKAIPEQKQVDDDENPTLKINKKLISVAANFWNSSINSIPFQQQLEVGVTIYLTMMVKDSSVKHIFAQNCDQEKIEAISLKFLNMMGWLIRSLLMKDVSLKELLRNLGKLHHALGVRASHFTPMLESLHETFEHYFPTKYRVQEKYAIDYIFELSTRYMMNANIIQHYSLTNHKPYLQSLDVCLKSVVGRGFLYSYLRETWCDEIAMYLQSMIKFKNQVSDKGRFIIARNIRDMCIRPGSDFAINISYQCQLNILNLIDEYESKFSLNQPFTIPTDLFKQVNYEINRLIRKNHWIKFVKKLTIQDLDNKN